MQSDSLTSYKNDNQEIFFAFQVKQKEVHLHNVLKSSEALQSSDWGLFK
jgi:hypothetical protein